MNHKADYILFNPQRAGKPPEPQPRHNSASAVPSYRPAAAGEDKNPVMLRAQMAHANPIGWGVMPAQIWKSFKIFALIVAGCWLLGWPVGDGIAYYTQYGTSPGPLYILSNYPLSTILFAVISPIIVLIIGYLLAFTVKMIHVAQAVSHNALTLMQPEGHTPHTQRMHHTIRQEVMALNAHIDAALARLADTESSIRQQARAIDEAGEALENGPTEMTEQISYERNQLIELTEQMNHEADKFAAAIAEKAKLGTDKSHAATARLVGAEQDLNTRLAQMEDISETAMDGLDRLAQAMETHHQSMTAIAYDDATSSKTSPTTAAEIAQAQQLIACESTRLEHLMSEQRQRAERLASVITTQITRLSELDSQQASALTDAKTQTLTRQTHLENELEEKHPPGEAQSDGRPVAKSVWRHILARAEELTQTPSPSLTQKETPPQPNPSVAAKILPHTTPDTADDTTAPVDASPILAPSPQSTDASKVDIQTEIVTLIRALQQFTRELYDAVHDTVPRSMSDRFDNGERNIFAHAILETTDSEIRQRLLLAISTSKEFQLAVTRFLRTFDALLEPASHPDASANLLDDYLNSPLGKVYLRIGSITGYFS